MTHLINTEYHLPVTFCVSSTAICKIITTRACPSLLVILPFKTFHEWKSDGQKRWSFFACWCYVSNANAVMHSGENWHMWKRLICCSAIGWYSTEARISNWSTQPLSMRCALVRTLDHFSCDLAQNLQKYSRIMSSRKRKLILSLFTFWKEDLFMLKGQTSGNIWGQFCCILKAACR